MINYIINIVLLNVSNFTDPNSHMKNEDGLLNIDVVLKAMINYHFHV